MLGSSANATYGIAQANGAFVKSIDKVNNLNRNRSKTLQNQLRNPYAYTEDNKNGAGGGAEVAALKFEQNCSKFSAFPNIPTGYLIISIGGRN